MPGNSRLRWQIGVLRCCIAPKNSTVNLLPRIELLSKIQYKSQLVPNLAILEALQTTRRRYQPNVVPIVFLVLFYFKSTGKCDSLTIHSGGLGSIKASFDRTN